MTEAAATAAKKPKQEKIPEPKNVYEAINFVMGRVGFVQKEEAEQLPYSFASEAAFIKAVRPHLVDVGLVVFQSGVELIERNDFTAKSGAAGINVLFQFEWTWYHAPSETSLVTTSIGEGADYGDKAANKAMTVAMKYNLRQTLVIETGDDPDFTPSEDFVRSTKTGKRIENQWEQDVVEKIDELQLFQARPHIVNVLNRSPFFESVPYGELDVVAAVAYSIRWVQIKNENPTMDIDERNKIVDDTWKEYLPMAYENLGMEMPEVK